MHICFYLSFFSSLSLCGWVIFYSLSQTHQCHISCCSTRLIRATGNKKHRGKKKTPSCEDRFLYTTSTTVWHIKWCVEVDAEPVMDMFPLGHTITQFLQLLLQHSKPKAKWGLLNDAEKQKWYASSLPDSKSLFMRREETRAQWCVSAAIKAVMTLMNVVH